MIGQAQVDSNEWLTQALIVLDPLGVKALIFKVRSAHPLAQCAGQSLDTLFINQYSVLYKYHTGTPGRGTR